jgi:hypothetical protein
LCFFRPFPLSLFFLIFSLYLSYFLFFLFSHAFFSFFLIPPFTTHKETETTNNDFKPDVFGAQFAPEIEVHAETKPKQVTYGDVKLVAEVRGSDACGF